MKTYKEHLPVETQSITTSVAALVSAKPQESMARSELAQLLAYRLKNSKPEFCMSSMSVFNNHQARLSKSINQTGNLTVLFLANQTTKLSGLKRPRSSKHVVCKKSSL